MIDRVKVGAVTYDVVEKDVVEIDGSRNYLGMCNYPKTTIEVLKNLSTERKYDVFAHELLHAILNEAGYDNHDEELVERVSKVLCQVLRDNDFGWMRIRPILRKKVENVKSRHSHLDKNGKLWVACSECVRGGNGEKSCSPGWKVKRGGDKGCFLGVLLPKYEIRIP